MRKILITGATGFIGKVLCRKLLEDPEVMIFGVDNLSSSELPDDLLDHDRFYFSNMDCANYLMSCGQLHKFDQVYHLAAPVGPVGVLKHAGNISTQIINDLRLAAERAIQDEAKLIYISTSEVYGKNPENPENGQPEDLDKIVPANYTVRLEYGVAKLLGEIMLSNIAKVEPRLKYDCIRPFNIVGIDQNADLGFVLPRFINQALHDEPLTVYNDGSDIRTFTNVKDFVDGIIAVMESDISGEVFNVGNPANKCSIKELAEMVQKLTGTKSVIDFVDPTTLHGKNFAEAWNKIPNIEKLQKMIGWEPKYNLVDTVKEVIASMGEPC